MCKYSQFVILYFNALKVWNCIIWFVPMSITWVKCYNSGLNKSFFVLFILTIWVSKSYRIESKQTLKKQLPRATSRGRFCTLNSQLGLVDRLPTRYFYLWFSDVFFSNQHNIGMCTMYTVYCIDSWIFSLIYQINIFMVKHYDVYNKFSF